MKYFYAPEGQFVIQLPTEWQYKNVLREEEEVSPFSFATYDGDRPWGFQISCYPIDGDMKRNIDKSPLPINVADTSNLRFKERLMEDVDIDMQLWGCIVDDHFFHIKFIYDAKERNSASIMSQIQIVRDVLTTLVYISPDKRHKAVAVDRVDKFIAALGASFDLKVEAVQKGCYIEAIIITANQIDAYLRMALLLQKQIKLKTDDVDLALLYQPKDAKGQQKFPEKRVYDMAKEDHVISQELHNRLYELYNERNKVVHQYIITDIKTKALLKIALEYEQIHNEVCALLAEIELQQGKEGFGVYAHGKLMPDKVPSDYLAELYASVNDKHLSRERNRPIG